MGIFTRKKPAPESRYGLSDYLDQFVQFQVNGNQYLVTTQQGSSGEKIENSFTGYVNGLYKSNGIVFAVTAVRLLLFAEARFRFRQFSAGEPGDPYGTPALRLLERPWPGGTTGELLARMEQDVTLAGNSYIARRGRGADAFLRRMRPDWVTIVHGSSSQADDPIDDLDARVAGYVYQPPGKDPIFLPADEVAHYSPYPDPEASWRGMSWLTPVVREVQADSQMTAHKKAFMENAATPNLVVKLDASVTPEKFEQFKVLMEDRHAGYWNAYKTLYLGGGADATVVGNNFQQIDFKAVQGAGETRIAAAGGVPPVVAGLSEGLSGSSLNAGNYSQARRRLADGTMRPLWRIAAASLESIVDVPDGSELWFEDKHISFLRDDAKDEAEIHALEATIVRQLVDAGYDPDAVVEAVTTGDFRRLAGKHSGLFSVQLQEPGGDTPVPEPDERYVGLQEQIHELRAKLGSRQIVDSDGNVILREEFVDVAP